MAKENTVRNNIWKWLVLALIAVVSIYVCNPPSEKLRFGLDLKGGTSFTLGVDTDKLAETIIAANPAITNTPGAVEAKIQETLKDCDEEVFIMGGAAIYQLLLPFTNRLYITRVYRDYEADVYFPTIDMSEFTLVNLSEPMFDEESELDYAYEEYDRKYRL